MVLTTKSPNKEVTATHFKCAFFTWKYENESFKSSDEENLKAGTIPETIEDFLLFSLQKLSCDDLRIDNSENAIEILGLIRKECELLKWFVFAETNTQPSPYLK